MIKYHTDTNVISIYTPLFRDDTNPLKLSSLFNSSCSCLDTDDKGDRQSSTEKSRSPQADMNSHIGQYWPTTHAHLPLKTFT